MLDRPYTPCILNIPYHTPTTPQGGGGEQYYGWPMTMAGVEGGWNAGPYIYKHYIHQHKEDTKKWCGQPKSGCNPIIMRYHHHHHHQSSSSSINQSINQIKSNQSSHQPINRSTDQPINRSIDQSINRSINQSINQSFIHHHHHPRRRRHHLKISDISHRSPPLQPGKAPWELWRQLALPDSPQSTPRSPAPSASSPLGTQKLESWECAEPNNKSRFGDRLHHTFLANLRMVDSWVCHITNTGFEDIRPQKQHFS